MANVVKAPFGAAAVLVGTLGLGGCGESPYEAPPVSVRKNQTGFSATLIQKGNFFTTLPERGAYRLDVQAEAFDGKPGTTVPCLLINDGEAYKGYGGISCDWSKLQPADGP